MLPDRFWFLIRKTISPADTDDNQETEEFDAPDSAQIQAPEQLENNEMEQEASASTNKRKLPDWMTNSSSKKSKMVENDSSEQTGGCPSTSEVNGIENEIRSSSPHQNENEPQIKQEPVNSSYVADDNEASIAGPSGVSSTVTVKLEVKEEPLDSSTDRTAEGVCDQPSNDTDDQKLKVKEEKVDAAADSTSSNLRDSCPHGIRCYRCVSAILAFSVHRKFTDPRSFTCFISDEIPLTELI